MEIKTRNYPTPWKRIYSHEAQESVYGGMCSGEILERETLDYSSSEGFHTITQYCSLTQGAAHALISSDDP